MIQTPKISPPIHDAIERLACMPNLLVACDYDGTLARIVADPSKATPERRSLIALRVLAELPHTSVAVISGRCLEDLARFMPSLEGVYMVGSHGSEFDANFADEMSQPLQELLCTLRSELRDIASRFPGVSIEEKPASVALHVRNASDEASHAAIEEVEQGPARMKGVSVKHGKQVIELCVIEMSKEKALSYIRERIDANACVFIGDDRTDEDVFRAMHGPDLGIKVGKGETQASMRLRDPLEVARFLAAIAEARTDWLSSHASVPIEQHSMLSDQRTIALLTPEAKVNWLCAPRIDSPAIFADLLGGPNAGHWSVKPGDGSGAINQKYIPSTMIVRTQFKSMQITDYLDCSGSRSTQLPGRSDLVRVIEGGGDVKIGFAPRLSYGQIPTQLERYDNGLIVKGSHDQIALHAPGVRWEIAEHGKHHTAQGTWSLDDGPLTMELRYGIHDVNEDLPNELTRRAQTQEHWGSWTEQLQLPQEYREQVQRSALLLRGLCYMPTGAIAAAGTTSLPERLGGVRNWDYRYCWPRDAAMAAGALVRLGSTSEALHLLDWIRRVLDTLPTPEALAPIYTVSGEPLGPETEIPELAGYAGSRPVRIGNAAAYQIQLDVFGSILDLVALLVSHGERLESWHWPLVESLAEVVAQRWQDPDHGIWEPRIAPRHHVHSKAMCWLALDSARRIGTAVLPAAPTTYNALLKTIKDDILEHGWNEHLGAFTSAYGTKSSDAATLWIGLSGMLPPDDERVMSNVEVVDRQLRRGSAVFRYFHDDGLPGDEGGFNICTAWLIESFALIGQIDRAQELFEKYISLAGQTGVMSEEHDPETGQALGNIPQAYSHLGLINAALALDISRSGQAGRRQ